MAPHDNVSDAHLTKYLLGLLPEDAVAEIDEASFTDDELADRLTALEHELYDAYAAGELTGDERTRFEEVFLQSPRSIDRLALARTLQRKIDAASPTPRASTRLRWLAAAAVLIATVAAWRTVFAPEHAPRTPAQDRIVTQAVPGPIFAFTLSATSSRSAAETATLVVPPGAETVRLTLAGEPGSPRLENPLVTIQTVEGASVFRGAARVSAGADALADVDVPASLLPPDDYIVRIDEHREGAANQERSRYFLRVRDR